MSSRYERKAETVRKYWKEVLGSEPPNKNAVILVLCVDEHESRCGDLKSFGYNHGACTIRGLSAADRAEVAAGTLKVGDIRNGGILYGDSSYAQGKYLTFFAAFPDTESGCAYFLKVLVKTRANVSALMANPNATTRQLAEAMYAGKYFLGIHNGATPEGKEANISDYARALEKLRPAIERDLVNWAPELDPEPISIVEDPVPLPAGPEMESATQKPTKFEAVSVAIILLSILTGLANRCDVVNGPNGDLDSGIPFVD